MLKYTDHELISMTQQYTQTREGDFICHLAFKTINEQVRNGRDWAKCMECGKPYPLDREGATLSFCSTSCENSYASYLEGSVALDM
jgi:hypothetical protein